MSQAGMKGQARKPAPTHGVDEGAGRLSLPDVVHRFKSYTTARYRHGVRDEGWLPFPGRVWQRNYHEHIVRGRASLTRIRRYIESNPDRWELDWENPRRKNSEETTLEHEGLWV